MFDKYETAESGQEAGKVLYSHNPEDASLVNALEGVP